MGIVEFCYDHLNTEYEWHFSNNNDASGDVKSYLSKYKSISEPQGKDHYFYITVNDEQSVIYRRGKLEVKYRDENVSYDVFKGYWSSELLDEPHKYIDAINISLDKEAKAISLSGELPRVSASNVASITDDKKRIFSLIIDALCNGKDIPIALICSSYEECVECIKMLYGFLPRAYAKKQGFCICDYKTVSSEIFRIPIQDRYGRNLRIKFWATSAKDFDFKQHELDCYYFDMSSENTNYKAAEGSIPVRLVEGSKDADLLVPLLSGNEQEKQRAINGVDIALALFDRNANSMEDSRRLLNTALNAKSGKNYGGIATDPLKEAVSIILSEGKNSERTEADLALVYEFASDSEIISGDKLLDFLLKIAESSEYRLDERTEALLIDTLVNDPSAERLSKTLSSSALVNTDFEYRVSDFAFACKVLAACIKKYRHSSNETNAFVRSMIKFFDVEEYFYKMKSAEDDVAFFDVADKLENDELKRLATAILMASAYFEDKDNELCETRVLGFKQLVSKINGVQEKLKFIIDVRSELIKIRAFNGNSLNIDNNLNFIFNTDIGRAWMSEFIADMSLESTLESYGNVGRWARPEGGYSGMSEAISARLLDIEFVRRNINNSKSLGEYSRFFRRLEGATKREHEDIAAYLLDVEQKGNVSDAFTEYRCRFVYDCYKTMPYKKRARILKGTDINAKSVEDPFKEMKPDARKRAVENTVNVFGSASKSIFKIKKHIGMVFIWAFLFAMLSVVIILAIPVIKTLMLKSFTLAGILKSIKWFIEPPMILIPIYVFLLNLFSYKLLKNGDRRERMRRAIIITLLCGILPLVVFVVNYLALYYISPDFKAFFNSIKRLF